MGRGGNRSRYAAGAADSDSDMDEPKTPKAKKATSKSPFASFSAIASRTLLQVLPLQRCGLGRGHLQLCSESLRFVPGGVQLALLLPCPGRRTVRRLLLPPCGRPVFLRPAPFALLDAGCELLDLPGLRGHDGIQLPDDAAGFGGDGLPSGTQPLLDLRDEVPAVVSLCL